MKTRSDQ